MTTREIFFKTIMSTDLPVGWVIYMTLTFSGENRHYKFEKIPLRFDKDHYEESIKRMEETESIPNFQFWTNSPEGQDFLERNQVTIGNVILGMIHKENE